MDIKKIEPGFAVSAQLFPGELHAVAAQGFRSVICNRPDGEAADQPGFHAIAQAAKAAGLHVLYLPVRPGMIQDEDAAGFGKALSNLPRPILAYCRTGSRSSSLWSLAQAGQNPSAEILTLTKAPGRENSGIAGRIANGGYTPADSADTHADVVIVGGGAAGIAVAASLRTRMPDLDIALLDPADVHYYQPGWTLVGGGVFQAATTARTMGSLIPRGVRWIKAAVAAFDPANNAVIVDASRVIRYDRLIVCPGIKLNWGRIEGLEATLGMNGVTSNYRYDLAPYTWELISGLKSGRAIFTQPPMPIKCAGAPQKAMYLAGDAWLRAGVLKDIQIEFMNAGGVLFGVKDYIPALMDYVRRYNAGLNFFHNLIAVDGPGRRAVFDVAEPGKPTRQVERDFDMIHVCPPQVAPDFIRASALADAAGWVDVDQATLRHKSHDNIWSLGDVMNAPNAKTAAAARKQAPVVAENVIADIRGKSPVAHYDGYGSCPLTVERGKIVLAEFGYGGALKPSFPKALLDGTRPSRAAWFLKERMLPQIYWQAMLRGREWLAHPEKPPTA